MEFKDNLAGKTILTLEQQKVLGLFQQDLKLPELFYLSGGTALAEFYLKHRYSDDLDFFTAEKEFPMFAVEDFVKRLSLETGWQVNFKKLYDRRMFFLQTANTNSLELKIEFTNYPFSQLSEMKRVGVLRVDSLLDIAVNKLMAMIERLEPKDFVDLYFLLQGEFKLLELADGVNKKFGFKIEPLTLGSELMKVNRIEFLPTMLSDLSLQELKTFFSRIVKELRPKIIE